ncbi:WW domain binding protein 1-like [Ptychodera flava]|uniref:WW domain binding protein 1-like n=1 Tax=Ptychodera flava TaxID=63121 RepID=UPI00396A752E
MEAIITLFTFAVVTFFDITEAIDCGGRFCNHREYCCAISEPHCCHHDDVSCCNTTSVIALSWFWLILFLLVVVSCGCCCCHQRRAYTRQGYVILHNDDHSQRNLYGSVGSTEYPPQTQPVLSPPPYEAVARAPNSVPVDQPPPAYSVK